MSRFITRQDDDTYLEEIESMEICKWRYNDVCANDKCPDLADYPYPSNKCEGSCPYFEKEDGIIEQGCENMIIQSTKEATREELIQRINELQDINEQHRILNGELREEINQLKKQK